VGIFARPGLREARGPLRELVEWLGRHGATPLLEQSTAGLLDGPTESGASAAPGADVAQRSDVVVVLGGDGTLLHTSRLIERPVPVLGVNFGSLGFLTEITLPELHPTLAAVLSGDYRFEERRMLRATLRRAGIPDVDGDVLNDVVVTKAALARIIELDVAVDGLFVTRFRADGLIVSTTTGSTAYNLAAGGPILHPALEALVLTPICPHMLTNRPLVVSDRSRVEVRLTSAQGEVRVVLDGQQGLPVGPSDLVSVSRSPRSIRLVKAAARDYYSVLRSKLKWGER
jgi:NAD+ kinase